MGFKRPHEYDSAAILEGTNGVVGTMRKSLLSGMGGDSLQDGIHRMVGFNAVKSGGFGYLFSLMAVLLIALVCITYLPLLSHALTGVLLK